MLEGHDIALPICGETEKFRIKLFASDDVASRPKQTMQQVDRLVCLDGGRHVGVVLLLAGDSGGARIVSVHDFQILSVFVVRPTNE